MIIRLFPFALALLCLSSHAQTLTVNPSGQPIPRQYIVGLHEETKDTASVTRKLNLSKTSNGTQLLAQYNKVFKGFAIRVPEGPAGDLELRKLASDPNVAFIEKDEIVTIGQEATLQPPAVQNNATWGLDRIDQADLPLNKQYIYSQEGAGVFAFVFDTGVLSDHSEFMGRLHPGATIYDDGLGSSDCNGHGTHVAGTIGGTTWGVAKKVTIVSVRVLGCNGHGAISGVMMGIEWMMSRQDLRPAVANFSLEAPRVELFNAAIASAVESGITVVVAAGNQSTDACTRSPSSELSAITVAAFDMMEEKIDASNFGPCVDIFAPGAGIMSAWHTSPTAQASRFGTSMAAPHVAGVAAKVLAKTPSATPESIKGLMISNASPNKILKAGSGSPNLALFSMFEGVPQDSPAGQFVSVGSMSASARYVNRKRMHWFALVNVQVRSASGEPVAGATVRGKFGPGNAAGCRTSRSGSCTLRSGYFRSRVNSTDFTINNIRAKNFTYDRNQNSATLIRVNRP